MSDDGGRDAKQKIKTKITHDGWTGQRLLTYLDPADVKSPHMSELGGASWTGGPKSKREAGLTDEEEKV